MPAAIRTQMGGIRARATSIPKGGRKPGKGRRRKLIHRGVGGSATRRRLSIKCRWLRNWQPVPFKKDPPRERMIPDVFPKSAAPRETRGQHPRVY